MLDDRSALDPQGTRASVAALFAPEAVLERISRLEVTLAEVQGSLGLIPQEAARAIACAPVPSQALVLSHRQKVGHPMVSILDAMAEGMEAEGREWLHFGATTADIFRTVTVQVLHEVAEVMDTALARIIAALAEMARAHRATPMIGRTLGRHALPISFGYKVAVWIGQLERDRDRLRAWRGRFGSGVLSGAVGTHAAMGPQGPEVEREVMARLGLGAPDPVDTKGAQDVFAEFGAAISINARTFHRIAQEVFLLQGDDIAELSIRNRAVGSSTMPHKVNPTLSVEIQSRAPEVGAALQVLMSWLVTIHERDSAIHFGALEQMCTDMAQLMSCAEALFDRLVVHPEAMRSNIERTHGAIHTEAVTVQLAARVGRRTAHELMQEATAKMRAEGRSLGAVIEDDPRFAEVSLPTPEEAMGEAPHLVDAALARLSL